MGKKATYYLIDRIIVFTTITLGIFSVIAYIAGNLDPQKYWAIAIISLATLPLLVADFLVLIYWVIRLKVWFVVPVIVLLLNIGFLTSTFQISFGSSQGYPDGSCDLKVATYNVHNFKAYDTQITVECIAYFMKEQGVDIICFQEFVPSAKYNLDSIRQTFDFLPYSVAPDRGGRGPSMAIFSKYPITRSESIAFAGTDNSCVWADINVDGRVVRVFNNHLQTTSINQSGKELNQITSEPLSPENRAALDIVTGSLRDNFAIRSDQAHYIRSVIDQTKTPVLVCGDFNDTPASYVYKQMVRGLRDGFKTSGHGYGYTYRPMLRMLRIDYIMYSGDDMKSVGYDSPDLEFSDHKPVLLELMFGK